MIFSGNTTALGANNIPMAEGYDCSYGVSLALVESARNDYAMFKALLQSDYREMAICKESSGVVMEGEVSALHEAVGGGIFKKIAELFRKLIAKIKSIFHNFIAKIRGLAMKDKDLVKKYQNELGRKSNLDKLEVKWRKYDKNAISTAEDFEGINELSFDESDAVSGWSDDTWERRMHYIKKSGSTDQFDSINEYSEGMIAAILEDEETITLGEIGGWRALANFLSDYASKTKKMETAINKANNRLNALVNKYNKAANSAVSTDVKTYGNKDASDDEKKSASDNVTTANKQYDMAQAFQDVIVAGMGVAIKINTILYKQHKAAFMKAITVNPKKLEESAVYLDAIAEAAEDEVDNVINSALSDEEISDLSVASTNVKDGDVSDDPDKLTYGPDRYTDNASFSDADGCIDTCIGGGKVEESAYFGKMFY